MMIVSKKMLIAIIATTLAACMETQNFEIITLKPPGKAVRLKVPKNIISNESDDGSYLILETSYPSFGPRAAGKAADVFIKLMVAGKETNAERLATSDPNRPGSGVPRLVASTGGVRTYERLYSRAGSPVVVTLFPVSDGWLRIDDMEPIFDTLEFNHRFKQVFELEYQVKREFATNPLETDAKVSEFINSLMEGDK